ncbi:hypothetical protein [Thalassotalea euphylliae]|uniref:DUF2147 domain-containing protein n=1 Tax=Thalassotalea euphylliae TaxID=1655234 RepID=A0A3E0UEH2_9GAMM|nr:hypothetical protein [Thalassotalea euphylliae]REL34222.1 hypothetical protein DXX92_02045 [Thalassotalea euphylliae]
MKKFQLMLLIVGLLFQLPALSASSIAGIWQHADKLAVIEFDLDKGIGTVKSHQTHPQNEGQLVIRKITKASQQENLWLGEIYDASRGIFVAISIKKEQRKVFVYDASGKQILALKRGR